MEERLQRGSCGQRSRQCQICSVLGSFCSKAQTLGRTTPCAPCSPVFQLRITTRTTRACGTLPKPCWMESLKQMRQKASSCRHSLPSGLWSARCAPVVYWGRCFAHDQPAHTRCGPRRAAQTESGGTHRRMFGRVARCIIRVGPQGLLVETITDRDSRAREWPHGWQYWAFSVRDTSFRKSSMLTGRPPHLRSLAHAPTTLECTVPPFVPGVTLGEVEFAVANHSAVLFCEAVPSRDGVRKPQTSSGNWHRPRHGKHPPFWRTRPPLHGCGDGAITTRGVTLEGKRHPLQMFCRTIRGRTVLMDGE